MRAARARNNVTALAHGTSIFEVRAKLPATNQVCVVDGLRLLNLPAALIASTPHIYTQNPTDVRTALALVRDASEVLPTLLEGGHTTAAGRLAGAFRNIARDRIAVQILETMRATGFRVTESDPFDEKLLTPVPQRERSPYVHRIRLLWQAMRQPVIHNFPAAPRRPLNLKRYLKVVENVYVTDAYHSLSIEGYRVSAELIERVRTGRWNPDHIKEDRDHRNALAARGYWLSFQAVQSSLQRVLNKENEGKVAEEDHSRWYQQLFAPSIQAGILSEADLAGYRSGQVYIRRSLHVPLKQDAVLDTMPVMFELLAHEDHPAVRAVLGHFMFVYIHPYMDGNGRIGRFLMNLMLASGGYPWTVIPVEKRNAYMSALESASVDQQIAPFAKLLGTLVSAELQGSPTAKQPLE